MRGVNIAGTEAFIVGDNNRFCIDDAVVVQAHRCEDSHRCLNDCGVQLCQIDTATVGGEVIFVDPEKCGSCTYRVSFGFSAICSCPVRKAIYKKYWV